MPNAAFPSDLKLTGYGVERYKYQSSVLFQMLPDTTCFVMLLIDFHVYIIGRNVERCSIHITEMRVRSLTVLLCC